jgi:hypothetical protein
MGINENAVYFFNRLYSDKINKIAAAMSIKIRSKILFFALMLFIG